MEDHDFAHFFASASAYLGLGISAFLLMSGIAAAGVQANNFMQSGTAQTATLLNGLPDDYGNGTVSVTKYPAYCPRLSQTTQFGFRDTTTVPQGQVSELQHFLSGYFNIDPTEIMTGYFGTITQNFVIQFQKAQGLPALGIVGSLTRAAIASNCGPQVAASLNVSPTSGQSPLTVKVTTGAPGTFTIDFGDESSQLTVNVTNPQSGISHTYANPGTYLVRLYNSANASAAQLVGTTNVVVSGASVQAGVQPANTVATQGQHVAFTTFTITTGPQSLSLGSISVLRGGTASDAALADVAITYAEAMGTARATIGVNHTANVYLTDPILLPANGTYHFTVWGDMASNVSQDNGKTIGLAVVSLNASSVIGGTLPIAGATNVVNSTVTQPTGSVSATIDASSPSYQIVAGGTTGVTIGVFKLTASNEGINLNKIGLTLTSGQANDLTGVHLYNSSGLLIGNATFTSNSTFATSTLSSPVNIPVNGTLQVIVKADISPIGANQPGTAGDLVKINMLNYQGAGANSGSTIAGSVTPGVAGVRIFKSLPSVSQLPDPTGTLTVGKEPVLLRFSVTAGPNGAVGFASMLAKIVASNVTFSSVQAYGFTDPAYSQVIAGTQSPNGKLGVVSPSGGLTGSFSMAINNGTAPFEIPAGATYYFEVTGDVSNIVGNGSVATTLSGDSSYSFGAASISAGSNFVWSPNDMTTSLLSTTDWTNGYNVAGLPVGGFTQTLTGSATAPVVTTPSGTIDQSSLTSTSTTVTLTGTASGVGSVGISLSNAGGTIYRGGPVAVTNGRWTATLQATSGTYTASLNGYSDTSGAHLITTNGGVLTTGTLTVTIPTAAPTIVSFTSDISAVPWTWYTELRASVNNAISCTVSGGIYGKGQVVTLNTWSNAPSTWQNWTGPISVATTYTLTCGTQTASLTVNINSTGAVPPVTSTVTNPASVPASEQLVPITASVTSGNAPLTVTFKGDSYGATQVSFGDGAAQGITAGTVTPFAVTHTYTTPGTYWAGLSYPVGGAAGQSVLITVTKAAPVAVVNSDTQRKQDLQTLATALAAYKAKHGTYIVTGAGAGGGGQGVVSADGLPTYKTIIQGLYADGDLSSAATLPANPASGGDIYLLYTCNAGQSFALSAKLDNPSAADISNIQTSCNGTGSNGTYTLYARNYAVSGS